MTSALTMASAVVAVAAADCRKGERVRVRFVRSARSTPPGKDDGDLSANGDDEEQEEPTTPAMVVLTPMNSAAAHHTGRGRRRHRTQSLTVSAPKTSRCCHTCGADLSDEAIVATTGLIPTLRGGRCFADAFQDGDCSGDVDGDVHRDRCNHDDLREAVKSSGANEEGSTLVGCALCTAEEGAEGDGDIRRCSASYSSPLYCSEGCRPSSSSLDRPNPHYSSSSNPQYYPSPSPHLFFCAASSGQLSAVGDYIIRVIRRGDEDVGYTLLATCLAFLSISSSPSLSRSLSSEGTNAMDTMGNADDTDGQGQGEEDERRGSGRTVGGGGGSNERDEARRAMLSDIVFGRGCSVTTPHAPDGDPTDATSRKKSGGHESGKSGDTFEGEESKPRMSMTERTTVEECWSLMTAALLTGSCRDDRDGREDRDHRRRSGLSGRHQPHQPAPPDLDSFVDAYVRVRRHFLLPHPVVVPSRLLKYLASGKLSELPEEHLSRLFLGDGDDDNAAPLLRPFVDQAFRNDGGHGDGAIPFDGTVGGAGVGESSNGDDGVGAGDAQESWMKVVMPDPSRSVLLRRMAARVTQVASDPSADDDDGNDDEVNTSSLSPFEAARHRFRVLCPAYASSLRHSCVPNCAVEGYYDDDNDDEMGEEEDADDGGGDARGNVDVLKAAEDGSRRRGTTRRRQMPGSGSRPGRPLRLRLIALHDLSAGEALTMSKIDHESLTSCVEVRSAALRAKLLLPETFRCDCVRCRYERMPYPDGDAFSRVDLKRLGDLAMQHDRYADAVEAYGLILAKGDHRDDDADDYDGDVLHARAAALLHMGRHGEAHEAWDEAQRLCRGSHGGIALQVRKREAYGSIFGSSSTAARTAKSTKKDIHDDNNTGSGLGKNGERKRPSEAQHKDEDHEEEGVANGGGSAIGRSLPPYLSLIGGTRGRKCFITAPGFPLLSSGECALAIRWAEEHAASSKNGGWTTSRHYAVPTTDVPVHEIPPLRSWFRSLLRHRLAPLLAEQFGPDEVGTDGSRIAVHDAFVVRYDADSGQSHLPMHRDESSHSFTVALNDRSEYDGGGTYVAELGRSVVPERGGVLSFRGDEVLHGGDPVVRGVRYILVAFCYVRDDDVSTVKRNAPVAPDSAVENFFKTGDQGHKHSFAFGFEL